MKKLSLLLLIISSLYSDAKIYMGASAGYTSESYEKSEKTLITNPDTTGDSPSAKFKIGYGDRDAYAIEFSFDYIDNKMSVFSQNDSTKYGMNVEFVKGFNLDTFVQPFFKAGFGAGFLDTAYENDKTINYGTFNLGAGLLIPISEHFDLELGYDYKYVSYERIEVTDSSNTVTDRYTLKSHINTIYTGFNVRF